MFSLKIFNYPILSPDIDYEFYKLKQWEVHHLDGISFKTTEFHQQTSELYLLEKGQAKSYYLKTEIDDISQLKTIWVRKIIVEDETYNEKYDGFIVEDEINLEFEDYFSRN